MSIFEMGAYTSYVWMAYALFFSVVLLQTLKAKQQFRRIVKLLKRQFQ